MANSSRSRGSVSKAIKKSHKGVLLLALLFLLIGAAAGAAVSWFMTKDDRFVLNGEKEITLAVGEVYEEQGAEVISFGRDISENVVISGDTVDETTEGVYQIVYSVEDLRWGEYQLVRVVTVGDGDPDNGTEGEGGAA